MRLGDPPKFVCQNGMTKKKGMEQNGIRMNEEKKKKKS